MITNAKPRWVSGASHSADIRCKFETGFKKNSNR